jgi:NADH-quinone oxidoreductase subunit A
MSSNNLDVFMPVLIFMGAAVVLFVGGLFAAYIISPSKKSKYKDMPYECGEEPVGEAWSAFNIRFYVVGLIFIIFDVESVLLFPVATIFKKLNDLGEGAYVLTVFLEFVFVLLAGLAYCWKKGDLDWVRSYQVPKKENNNSAEQAKGNV